MSGSVQLYGHSPPGSSIHWILQATILEWVAISFSILITLKPLIVGITTNWKILKEIEIPDHLTCLQRNLYAGQEAAVRTSQEQQTGSKLGKEYVKALYCHAAYLTSMQSTSWEVLGWMCSTSWNQDCWKKYQRPQICRWHHPNGTKQRGTKEPLEEGERGK